MYELNASLASFSPKKLGDVAVGLGQIKRVDFTLALASVAETVQVTAESPLVDVKQSARQTNIRAEQIEFLPKGRDFSSLVTQAPGANQEDKLGGISIDGASAGENRFIIDGIETTDVQDGTQGKRVIADFLEEVQVKSSGYTAEYGGATGGVINVLTKSGTNNWHGNLLFNFEGDQLRGENRPTLRINLNNALAAEYVTYPKDSVSRVEPGFSVGGPLALNRAWFFGAYQPALTTNERIVNSSTAQNPGLTASFDEDQKIRAHFLTGNATSQFTDSLRGRLSYNNSWSRTTGLLPAQTGTDPAGTNYGYTQTFPNWSLSGNLDWSASPKLFFGVRGGYYRSDINDSNTTDEIRYLFRIPPMSAARPRRRARFRRFRRACSARLDSRACRTIPRSRETSRPAPTSKATARSTRAWAATIRSSSAPRSIASATTCSTPWKTETWSECAGTRISVACAAGMATTRSAAMPSTRRKGS